MTGEPIPTELYTAEAAESKRRAKSEVLVPDPPSDHAKKILDKNQIDGYDAKLLEELETP